METCTEHSKTMKAIQDDISEIKRAIVGDINGSIGLICKISNLESRIIELEKFVGEIKGRISNVIWMLILASFIGGLITYGVDKLLK